MADNKLSIEFLKPEECNFKFNNNGFLVLTLKAENKGRVKLIRSYPYTLKEEYICVQSLENEEIGIIRDLKDLDEGSSSACTKELESRY